MGFGGLNVKTKTINLTVFRHNEYNKDYSGSLNAYRRICKMKFILLITAILFSSLANAQFVHPLNLDGSEAQKKEVITYITNRVKHDYCGTVDMCQQVIERKS